MEKKKFPLSKGKPALCKTSTRQAFSGYSWKFIVYAGEICYYFYKDKNVQEVF